MADLPMLPKKKHPPNIQGQLDQLIFVMFGQGDPTQSLSRELVNYINARLWQYHLRPPYEASEILVGTYIKIARKIIDKEITIKIQGLTVTITSGKREPLERNVEYWLKRFFYNGVRDLKKKELRFNKRLTKITSHIIFQESHISLDSNILSVSCEGRNETQEDLLQKALSKLSVIDKEIILLRYVDELKWGEIGERLHISEATARKKGNRALSRLREHFNLLDPDSNQGSD
ncbi:MAG: sigma-70 family RNA polymerase sigma factor [Symploca sp. SIO2G7]|nr:sigma-70 family RNA polymerase sigma factor [Symploca sp. SIO2G7]